MQRVSNVHSSAMMYNTCRLVRSEIVEDWIVPDFPSLVLSLGYVPPDTTIDILKNRDTVTT